jgi:hypothetical protein
MLSTIKHVALGLVIGILATALVAVAGYFSMTTTSTRALAPGLAGSVHQPSGTSTPVSPSPTHTSTPTFTLNHSPAPLYISSLPSETPDAIQTILNDGGLVFSGPLSNAEQIALYKSSIKYVRSTAEDSRRVSKQINGVGYGDPSNICGPLAVAILRDAGLINPEIVPHDFWLLNPSASTDQRLLAEAFPADSYSYTRILTPLNKMNWQATPLLPGDFLFIRHGSGGNFDHMLVVSRVDSSLRTYAVTNYGTSQGYVIAETVLYDPNDPAAGIFHTWTKEREAILGATGFGGFDLWRRKTPS